MFIFNSPAYFDVQIGQVRLQAQCTFYRTGKKIADVITYLYFKRINISVLVLEGEKFFREIERIEIKGLCFLG